MRLATSKRPFGLEDSSAENARKLANPNVRAYAWDFLLSKMKQQLNLRMDVWLLCLGFGELGLSPWSALVVLNDEMAVWYTSFLQGGQNIEFFFGNTSWQGHLQAIDLRSVTSPQLRGDLGESVTRRANLPGQA
jgi:hypothetical protein